MGKLFRVSALVSTLALSTCLLAQGGRGGAGGGGGQAGRNEPQEPRPYDQVITDQAETQAGMFKVHRLGETVYFEIPKDLLGRDMFWSTEIAELPAGFGYGGTAVGDRVVRFERRQNTVYLRNVDFRIRTFQEGSLEEAIRASSLSPIIMAFNVEAVGPNDAPVVNVTRLYTTDVAEFSVRSALGANNVDAARSYLDRIKAFPENIETRSLLTFSGAQAGAGGGQGPGGPGRGAQRPNLPSITALVHYSLALLPEEPMMGRFFDSRVGFFAEGFQEYGSPENRVVERRFITRYRLEKKNPGAALSDPVKPIVYYISREVPDKWRPYIKQGVEDWQVAYEQAGFSNAIIAKDAPSREEDPFWDPEDARYSVIRWAPTPTENAMGPHVHDPRSGEILSAHIIMWHNILQLLETWYFTQASPMDPRAHSIPFPDDLLGELVRYVVAHEVGHTLGLQHNFKASSTFTIAQLRDPAFTRENGVEASIMDYGRFNYVAQPGDGAHLMPKVAAYDKFAIEWGYKPIPSAKTPFDEKSELDRMAARQVTDPTLRFENSSPFDPTVQTEDLGDDPIEAARLGLMNIDRVMTYLVPATTKFGEDYERLELFYSRLWSQRNRELRHVLALVGGVVKTDYHAGRGDLVYAPVPRARQRAAVQFLLQTAFRTPHHLLRRDLLLLLEPSGVTSRVLGSQRGLISSLLAEDRVQHMLDLQIIAQEPYTVRAMVTDLQNGIWQELGADVPVIDLYRRNLQRAYLEIIDERLNGPSKTTGELRPILHEALDSLRTRIAEALVKTVDGRPHLQDCLRQIELIKNPKTVVQAAPPTTPTFGGRGGVHSCWEWVD